MWVEAYAARGVALRIDLTVQRFPLDELFEKRSLFYNLAKNYIFLGGYCSSLPEAIFLWE
jgi:hypothetical protein